MKKAIIAALAIVAMAGCTKDSNEMNDVGSSAVAFSIGDIAAQSRAEIKSTWAEDGSDKVGIYTDDDTYINIGYSVGSGGTLSPDGEKIYYTSQDQPTTFYAYYPYDSSVEGYKIPIDVSDQSKMIDLLVSEKVSDTQNAAKGVVFNFSHVLSSMEITISGSDILSDLSTLSVWTESVVTDATYSFLSASNNISPGTSESKVTLDVAAIEGDGEGRYLAQAIMIPNDYTSTTIYFSFVDNEGSTRLFSQEIGKEFLSGYRYTYDAKLGYDYENSFEATGELTWGDETESEGVESTKFDIVFDDDTYYIQSAKGMRAFADLVNGAGSNSSEASTSGDAAYFDFTSRNVSIDGQLTADIDLEGGTSNKWTAMGSYYNGESRSYTGKFDGGGHTISGLYIQISSAYQGLFGCAIDATIENVTISDPYVNAYTYTGVGSIVGYLIGGTISNCHAINGGTIIGNNAGGIVGTVQDVTNIINCSNSADVSYTGSYTGTIGGIVSYVIGSSTITNCYNSGDVKSSSASGYPGGILGCSYRADALTITNCYSSGGLTGGENVGGIVGEVDLGFPQTEIINLDYCYCDNTYVLVYYMSTAPAYSNTGCEAMSATDMQLTSFGDKLNTIAKNITGAYKWEQVEGYYPTLTTTLAAE